MGNSVIYRPAYDAEVEYLESTGTQYIDTGFRPDSTTTSFELDISFEGTFVYSGTSKTIIQQSVIEMDKQFSMNFGDGPNQGGDIFLWFGRTYDGLGGASVITNTALTRGIFRYSQGIVSHSGTSVDVNNSSFPPTIGRREGTMCILKDLECYNARLYGVKIWDNNVLVRDFIPVRIGQVGYLYDKVSKQLFANKGTGNFILGNDVSNAVIPQQRCVLYFGNQRSVGFERIYEEYEWLVGDGSAYIDTLIYDLTVKSIYCKLERNAEITDWTTTRILGREGDSRFVVTYANTSYTTNIILWTQNRSYAPRFTTTEGWIRINFEDNLVETHQSSESIETYTIKSSNLSIILFGDRLNTTTVSRIYKGKIGQLTVNQAMNLIPVKLLRPIPAILDGNGITRQAGECGMWDKVSNKFYGNVANSGTFTVKGPKCYEEYKWLKVQLYARGTAMSIPIHSRYVSFNRVWNIPNNSSYFYSLNGSDVYNYYADGTFSCVWYDNGHTRVFKGKNYSSGDVIDILTNQDSVIINGEEITWYGKDVHAINFNLYLGGVECDFLTSSITVDGSVRYVPCKLTHGIPASMDANGISRPAGTCGMWDKVNDKFYGNVANSGSFTVSND